MKKITAFIFSLFLCVMLMPANAQINWGLRGGLNVSKLNINDFKNQSATGWFVGPTTEFTLPIIGLGFDASLLYSRINSEVANETLKFNYLSIPLNLKFKLMIPIAQPFIYAGPEYNVKLGTSSDRKLENILGRDAGMKGSEWSCNIGAGIDLLSRLQVYAAYNFGFTDIVENRNSKQSIWRMGAVVIF